MKHRYQEYFGKLASGVKVRLGRDSVRLGERYKKELDRQKVILCHI